MLSTTQFNVIPKFEFTVMPTSGVTLILICITMNLGTQLVINQSQLDREIETLSRISETTPPNVTRILYTSVDQEARSYVARLARLTDLSVKEDAIGNTFFKWKGTDRSLKPIATGSHIDAIPYSGKYDGVVGVLGCLLYTSPSPRDA